MTPEEQKYLEIGHNLKDTVQSQLFGKPCFKISGKAFVAFFQNSMVFKLTGDAHKEAFSLDGAQLFDPSGKGRPMKEWVQVPGNYQSRWPEFAASALYYVQASEKK
jgi:hypothetical protein